MAQLLKSIYCNGGSGNAGVSDLSFLRGMTNLENIDLQIGTDAEEIDLISLAGLTRLKQLRFYTNGQSAAISTDLSPLSGLTELEYLQIPTEVESLAPLAGLTNLRQLYMESYGRNSQKHILTDISALRNMTKLSNLSLRMGR